MYILFPFQIRKILDANECAFNNCLLISEPGCTVKGNWERYQFHAKLLQIKIKEKLKLRSPGNKKATAVRYDVFIVFYSTRTSLLVIGY